MKMFLGIDWGGTYIKAGLVNSDGQIIEKEVYASDKLMQREVFLKELGSIVKGFKKAKIQGIGIGAPGIINTSKGFIYYLPNIVGWENYPLKNVIEKRLRLPVFVNNDANVFALAESRFGAGKNKSRAIFLTLGTGLGGAVICNNKILDTDISALELGHVPISLGGRLCSCGGKGCIETFVGNKYLLSRYRRLKTNKTKVKEVKDIFSKALKKEKEALIVWQEFSSVLGKFLVGMVNIFNPQVIIFGGGVSGAFKIFKPYVWGVIKKQAMWPQVKGLTLVKAKLKDAGIIGAALLAQDSLSS